MPFEVLFARSYFALLAMSLAGCTGQKPSVGYLGGNTTNGGGQYYVRHVPVAYLIEVEIQLHSTKEPGALFRIASGSLQWKSSQLLFHQAQRLRRRPRLQLGAADNWLKNNIDPLIKNSAFQNDGLHIVVFDESGNDNTNGRGRVVCALISPAFSKRGYQSTTVYQHESVLRLTLEGLGVIVLPGAASNALPFGNFYLLTVRRSLGHFPFRDCLGVAQSQRRL